MRIDQVEIDDGNIGHLTRHGVTIAEVVAVFENRPTVRRNKGHRSADYYAIANNVRVNFPVPTRSCPTHQCVEAFVMPEPSDDMTEQQLADWQYAHREQMDADEGDEIDVDISPRLSVTMSFRLPADEADAIRTTASRAGMTLSDWIRRACAAAVQEDETRASLTPVVQQLAEVFQDLTDARNRLGTVLGDEAPTDDPRAPRQRSGTSA